VSRISMLSFVREFKGLDPPRVYNGLVAWLDDGEIYRVKGRLFPQILEIVHGWEAPTSSKLSRDTRKNMRFDLTKTDDGTKVLVQVKYKIDKNVTPIEQQARSILSGLLGEAWAHVEGKPIDVSKEALMEKSGRLAIKKENAKRRAAIGFVSMAVGLFVLVLIIRTGPPHEIVGPLIVMVFGLMLLLGGYYGIDAYLQFKRQKTRLNDRSF
jgi:hypothetical protein